jgi:hypothetical protein
MMSVLVLSSQVQAARELTCVARYYATRSTSGVAILELTSAANRLVADAETHPASACVVNGGNPGYLVLPRVTGSSAPAGALTSSQSWMNSPRAEPYASAKVRP